MKPSELIGVRFSIPDVNIYKIQHDLAMSTWGKSDIDSTTLLPPADVQRARHLAGLPQAARDTIIALQVTSPIE